MQINQLSCILSSGGTHSVRAQHPVLRTFIETCSFWLVGGVHCTHRVTLGASSTPCASAVSLYSSAGPASNPEPEPDPDRKPSRESQETVPGGAGADDALPMSAAESAAMAAGMDAAFAAAANCGDDDGAENGAAIVDPRDGRVGGPSRPPPSCHHVHAAHVPMRCAALHAEVHVTVH